MSRPGERNPETGEIIQPNQFTTVRHPSTGERMLRNVHTGELISAKGTPYQYPPGSQSPLKSSSTGSMKTIGKDKRPEHTKLLGGDDIDSQITDRGVSVST